MNRSRTQLACGVVLALSVFAPSSAAAQNAISPAQFESMIFQQYGSASLVRERWQFSLNRQIRRIHQSIPLSDAQQQELRLAGQGDIQRFFNRVVAAQHKFQALSADEADFNGAYKIAEPLQRELVAGPFGNQSLFAKVLETTLDESQRKVHDEIKALRRYQQKEFYARIYLANLESNLPITDKQRELLVELLASRLEDMPQGNQLRFAWVAYHLSSISTEKLAEIFDAEQMAALQRIKALQTDAEQFLRQQGVLDDGAE